MRSYPCLITRVVDGDTVEAIVDVGFRMRYEDKFRLVGVNAPEGKNSSSAMRVRELLPTGARCEVLTEKPEKFGRWLADFILSDGRLLTAVLVEEGMAVPYFGGKRE